MAGCVRDFDLLIMRFQFSTMQRAEWTGRIVPHGLKVAIVALTYPLRSHVAMPFHDLHQVTILISWCVIQDVAWIDMACLPNQRVRALVACTSVLQLLAHARLQVFRTDN